MSLAIGSRVLIEGKHPHAGKVGIIDGAYAFKYGMGNALKINRFYVAARKINQ